MIQMVPEQQNSKLTALLLLVVALLLVYLLVFHWFIVRHMEYAEELSLLEEQLGRFQSVVAQRESLQQQLAKIRETRSDEDLFLDQPDFNEAAAEMSDRLGQMVQTLAANECQIVSRQPVRPRVQERFQRVTVNVRMRCHSEEMVQILYRLESEIPMVIVEDLNVIRPRARRRSNDEAAVGQALDVRFNMSAYLKS
jgi:general secretion pathway protein M